MLRSAVGKVAWVARATTTVVGLAIILALVVGVASSALGANGQSLVLGSLNNAATALTRLTGNVDGPAVQITNPNAGTNDTALTLSVQPGEAPLRVNSATRVPNLNADKLDGLDSASLIQARGDTRGNAANFRGILQHSEGFSFLNSGFSTVVAHAPEGPPVDVGLSCPSQTGAGSLLIRNNTREFGDSQNVLVDDGSTNPSFDTLGQNQSVTKTVSPGGDHFTIRVVSVFGENRTATIDLFTERFGPSVCAATAHVVYTFP